MIQKSELVSVEQGMIAVTFGAFCYQPDWVLAPASAAVSNFFPFYGFYPMEPERCRLRSEGPYQQVTR